MYATERAYAKINLYLDVLGKRPDGYHSLLTLMQSVSLFDTIDLCVAESEQTEINIKVEYPREDAADIFVDSVPSGSENLVYKAASAYLLKTGITSKVDIVLTKRIPVGAGLGGGSSDAAAALRAMNKVFGFMDDLALLEIAAELGSDVPFCLPKEIHPSCRCLHIFLSQY